QRRDGFVHQLLRTRSAALAEESVRERALKLLAFLEIEHLAHAEAQSLPYGLQRMVEIARALATGPSILLLDEPAAGVNPSEIGRSAPAAGGNFWDPGWSERSEADESDERAAVRQRAVRTLWTNPGPAWRLARGHAG